MGRTASSNRVTNKGWVIYLLCCGRRTYVGATTDITRRIRQHNREISGGARATAGLAPGWTVVLYITGFKSHREALRWEALVKKRSRGLQKRTEAMLGLLQRVCPAPRSTKSKQYRVPTGLKRGA